MNKPLEFKDLLCSKPCIGTFLKIPRPEVVDILALANFDFIICDMEHAQIRENEAFEVIRASVLRNLPIIIRLPDASQGIINRLLEAGATGIQIPRLRTKKDINLLNSFMKFPPIGTRSVGRANINAVYGEMDLNKYIRVENKRVLTIGQFETKEIERPIDDLFENLDIAFIGPTDLSVDFGVPGNSKASELQERIKEIEDHAKKTNTILGAFAGNIDSAKSYIKKGYNYIAISGDLSILSKGSKKLVNELKQEIIK